MTTRNRLPRQKQRAAPPPTPTPVGSHQRAPTHPLPTLGRSLPRCMESRSDQRRRRPQVAARDAPPPLRPIQKRGMAPAVLSSLRPERSCPITGAEPRPCGEVWTRPFCVLPRGQIPGEADHGGVLKEDLVEFDPASAVTHRGPDTRARRVRLKFLRNAQARAHGVTLADICTCALSEASCGASSLTTSR